MTNSLWLSTARNKMLDTSETMIEESVHSPNGIHSDSFAGAGADGLPKSERR